MEFRYSKDIDKGSLKDAYKEGMMHFATEPMIWAVICEIIVEALSTSMHSSIKLCSNVTRGNSITLSMPL